MYIHLPRINGCTIMYIVIITYYWHTYTQCHDHVAIATHEFPYTNTHIGET